MAKRSPSALTLRERECIKVARDKAVRKWVQAWRRRLLIAGIGALGVALLSASLWEWRSHGVSNTVNAGAERIYALTGRLGFTVRTIYLEGRRRADRQEVHRILEAVNGRPIFSLSLNVLRGELESVSAVKYATVERELPSGLRVRLHEREPVAIWQHGGKLSLVDDEGAAMKDLDVADYAGLPLVIGAGAPAKAAGMRAVLAREPELAAQVAALIRVGDRRWNIRFRDGLELKLPELGAGEAWARFGDMQRAHHLLQKPIKSVDLRQKGRVYIRFIPADTVDAAQET